MDKVQQKKELVQDLIKLHKAISVPNLYLNPDHSTTKDWLANVLATLKYLSENDYQAFQRLQDDFYLNGVDSHFRESIAQSMDRFIRQKIAEYKKNDFSELIKSSEGLKNNQPPLNLATNYWNYINPFWVLWKLISFIWKHKIISVIIIIITILASDYSLAWKNTLSVIDFILGLFK